jgi:hypothetical protein
MGIGLENDSMTFRIFMWKLDMELEMGTKTRNKQHNNVWPLPKWLIYSILPGIENEIIFY